MTKQISKALSAILVLFLGTCLLGAKCFKDDHTNVILFSIDTLRFDHLGINDPSFKYSPNIDEWSRAGVVFSRAYATAPWTWPSQNSLMTSTYPSQHGQGTGYHYCDAENIVSLAGHLKSQGYATASFNEVDLLYFKDGFDQVQLMDREEAFNFDQPLEWIEAHRAEKFFMLVHTMEVHDYMWLEDNSLGAAKKRYPDYDGPWASQDVGRPTEHYSLIYSSDEDDLEFHHAMYEEKIKYVDAQFKALLDKLAEMELLENTVIILTSDHGEGFDPGNKRVFHGGRLHEDQVHVPLIFSGPGLPAGVKVERPVSLVDVAPSVLSLCKASVPESMMGEPLLRFDESWFRERIEVVPEHSEMIFFEESLFCIASDGIRVPIHRGIGGNVVKMFGVLAEDLKYISTRAQLNLGDGVLEKVGRDEVYYLDRDPGEMENIENQTIRNQMSYAIKDIRTNLHQCADGVSGYKGIDEKLMDDLKALGYVE